MIAERYQFHQRSQRSSESVADYIAELRKLALHCEFGKFLNDALQDRLVCGLRNVAAQKQLILQTELTLDKALRGMEAAEESTKKLQGSDSSSSSSINRAGVTRDQARQPSKACGRCGKFDHFASACQFRKSVCNN